MAEVWFNSDKYEILCFSHAVKEVIENNSIITPFVDNPDSNDYTGHFYTCQKCKEEYDKDMED